MNNGGKYNTTHTLPTTKIHYGYLFVFLNCLFDGYAIAVACSLRTTQPNGQYCCFLGTTKHGKDAAFSIRSRAGSWCRLLEEAQGRKRIVQEQVLPWRVRTVRLSIQKSVDRNTPTVRNHTEDAPLLIFTALAVFCSNFKPPKEKPEVVRLENA